MVLPKDYKIGIDNGHGLKTAGKRTPPFPDTGQVIHEWEFNHATAKKFDELMKYNGFETLLISDTELDTPLNTRTKMANDAKVDLFVSFHYNAYKSIWGSHGGIETLYSQGSKNGEILARLVQKELISATKLRDRGVKSRPNSGRDKLAVLTDTKMPSVLLELGFMDNLSEAKFMLEVDYQWKCAIATAKAICQYYNIKYKEMPIKKPSISELYRIRKSWDDAKSQIGAYANLEAAKRLVDTRKDYNVYDSQGELVYPERKVIMQLEYKRALRKGMKGEDVKNLQIALVELGYNPNGIDSSFGNGLDSAIRLLQKDNKLQVDGSVGQATINKINQLLSGKTDIPRQSTVQPQYPTPTVLNKSKYYKKGDVHIIETIADNIEIKILGNTLANAKVFGVNGTFYDTPRPTLKDSCWAIATNNGKAIGGNDMLVSYNNAIKRGSIVYYKDGTVDVLRVNSINEYPKPHQWSISGYSVYPFMGFKAEKMPSGIDYKTAHTFIAYKDKNIYLMVKPNCMIRDILPLVREMQLDGCLVLDGGGSSQLRHPNGNYNSTRRINSAVLLKEV